MKRIFIGIKVESDRNFKKLISSLKKELEGENLKWTSIENIHITLAFLGYTHEEKIDAITRMLKSKCDEKVRFEISLQGFGIFRNLHDPKVLWAGMYQSEKLKLLQAAVVEGLKEIEVQYEDRPFSPHLTIARIKHIEDKDNLKILLLKYHDTDIQKVPVNEVILYESVLRQNGPEYKPLAVVKLP